MALIVPPNRDRTIENVRERGASFLPSEFVQLFFQLPIKSRLQKLSLKGMRYLNDIYDTDAQHTLFMSGRQVAKSTTLGNKMLSYSVLQAHFKSLYVSPSQMQTGQFSNDRIKLPLYYSPHLNAFVNSTLIDRVSHRQFVNGSEIRLRYAFLNADRIRGVMTDLLTIDEFQDILIKLLPVIEETLFTSPYKLKCYAGTPKSADNALAYYWENYSTQNDWMIPCDHGSLHPNGKRVWNQVGEANIPKRSEDGLVCASCRKSIHSMHPNSQWVAANPTPRYSDGRALEIPFQGFRIPQLIYPNVDWKTLINNYNQYPRQQFFNEVLGLPYDSGLRPLTKKQLQEWCDPEASITDGPFPKNLKWARGAISDTFLGVDWGCYSEDTRTLTENGFKYHWEIGEAEKIAQYDPNSGEMTFVVPKKKIVFDHEGDMIKFKSKNQDLLVTPDHKMVWRRAGGRNQICEAQDLVGKDNVRLPQQVVWVGEELKSFRLPAVTLKNGWAKEEEIEARDVPADLWFEFVGWLVSEGGFCGGSSGSRYVVITQRESKFPERVVHFRGMLDALEFKYGEYYYEPTGDLQFKIYGKQLWSWVEENIGVKCAEKRIPRSMMSASQRQLKILLDAAMLGDGTWDSRYPQNGAYYATSRALIDDLQEVALRVGYCTKSCLHKEAEGNRKTRYRLLLSPGRERVLHSRTGGIERVPYKGKAYCFSVPSGFFVTERNGCVSLQGNTGENSYTYAVVLGLYNGKIRILYYRKFTGSEVEPDRQIAAIQAIVSQFNVKIIGADYGGGFDRNYKLTKLYGMARVVKYQYVGEHKKKINWDGQLGRYLLRRSEIMADVFEAVKKGAFVFPRWEEMDQSLAKEMLSIFSEYNETRRMTTYGHAPGAPDDGFHALLYAFLALALRHNQSDVLMPYIT